MDLSIEQLQEKLLDGTLQQLFHQAYEQGVSDARNKKALPYTLRKKDLADLFQVELVTVEKIIRMEGFPKSKVVAARYPRDLVLEWAEKNTECVHYNRLVI